MEKYLIPKNKAEGEVEDGAQQKKKHRKEEIVDIPLKDNGLLKWDPKFLSNQEADALYKHLEETLNWTQPSLNIYGKMIPIPRLQSWMAGLCRQLIVARMLPCCTSNEMQIKE